MTIIPTKIMSVASTMECSFTSFIEGQMVPSQVPELKTKQARREFVNHIFHYEIDQKRVMEASILVVEYILQHKNSSRSLLLSLLHKIMWIVHGPLSQW